MNITYLPSEIAGNLGYVSNLMIVSEETVDVKGVLNNYLCQSLSTVLDPKGFPILYDLRRHLTFSLRNTLTSIMLDRLIKHVGCVGVSQTLSDIQGGVLHSRFSMNSQHVDILLPRELYGPNIPEHTLYEVYSIINRFIERALKIPNINNAYTGALLDTLFYMQEYNVVENTVVLSTALIKNNLVLFTQ